MARTRILAVGLGAMLSVACTDDGEAIETTGPTSVGGTGTTGSTVTITTIDLPTTATTGDQDTGTTADSTSGVDESSGGTTSASTGPTDSSSDGGSSSGEPVGSSSDSGATTYDVQWCILQYPPMVAVAVDEAFTIYARLFAPGLTDLTGVTDPAPELVVELGYSVDGSNPDTGVGAPWTWVPAMPNAGYGPGAPGYSAANDEYQGDLSIGMAGIYDYAVRMSGDSGSTWVYCDLDGLTVGGYTTDQAGDAAVGQ